MLRAWSLEFTTTYRNLDFCRFLYIMNPSIDFKGTLQKSRFWWGKIGVRVCGSAFRRVSEGRSALWRSGLGPQAVGL